MDSMIATLLVHSAATLAMCGLIWFVQVVHYPLLARVGRNGFADYEQWHSRLTTFVVGPLMLTETATASLLFYWMPGDPAVWIGGILLTSIWLSTWFVQVPQHRRLERGFDTVAYRRLVVSNWFRTVAWSARGVIALVLVARVIDVAV